eukprot:6462701-Amphidinium_carterae.1
MPMCAGCEVPPGMNRIFPNATDPNNSTEGKDPARVGWALFGTAQFQAPAATCAVRAGPAAGRIPNPAEGYRTHPPATPFSGEEALVLWDSAPILSTANGSFSRPSCGLLPLHRWPTPDGRANQQVGRLAP